MKTFRQLLEGKNQILFHGTRSSNLINIKSKGLTIGSKSNTKSHGYGGMENKIFLAETYNEAFYFISQFVKSGEPVAVLQIKRDFEIESLGRAKEWVTHEDIPASLMSIWGGSKMVPLRKLNPENINYINYDLLKGADKTVALKYWSN
jgi:hypothetical protein